MLCNGHSLTFPQWLWTSVSRVLYLLAHCRKPDLRMWSQNKCVYQCLVGWDWTGRDGQGHGRGRFPYPQVRGGGRAISSLRGASRDLIWASGPVRAPGRFFAGNSRS